MSSNLKLVEPAVDGRREALARAIEECRDADAAAAKANAAVTSASRMIDSAEAEQAAALERVEEAKRLHVDKLVAAAGAGKDAPANGALAKARILEADAADGVASARAAFQQLQATATSTMALAGRAAGHRQKAIQALMEPEVGRLMADCERLTAALTEARQALKFAGSMVDPYSDDRRAVDRYLSHDMGQLFPLENGFRAAPSAARAAWKEFAERITNDAGTTFPT